MCLVKTRSGTTLKKNRAPGKKGTRKSGIPKNVPCDSSDPEDNKKKQPLEPLKNGYFVRVIFTPLTSEKIKHKRVEWYQDDYDKRPSRHDKSGELVYFSTFV